MSTNYTQQYQLSLWEPEDKVQRAEFNENHQKIETALKGLKTDKAEQSALDALAGQVIALEQGKLVYTTGQYTGKGEYGKTKPNRLEFDFKPLLVIVSHSKSTTYGNFPWIRGQGVAAVTPDFTSQTTTLTWEEQAISWYHPVAETLQLNSAGVVYNYIAFGVPV